MIAVVYPHNPLLVLGHASDRIPGRQGRQLGIGQDTIYDRIILDLQDPNTRGQDCQSMGKLESIIGHRALIVSLEKSTLDILVVCN